MSDSYSNEKKPDMKSKKPLSAVIDSKKIITSDEKKVKILLTGEELVRGIVMAEIIGPPAAKRNRKR